MLTIVSGSRWKSWVSKNGTTAESSDDGVEAMFVVDVFAPATGWVRAASDLDEETADELATHIIEYQNPVTQMGVSSDNVRVIIDQNSNVEDVDWGALNTTRTGAINTARTQTLCGNNRE